MKRRIAASTISTFALIAYAAVTAVCASAETDVAFDITKLPPTGNTTSEFVPEGFKIERELNSDLNGDGITDALVQVKRGSVRGEKGTVKTAGDRGLIILLRDGKGAFRRVGANAKLLPCADCGGVAYGPGTAPSRLEARKGVMVISTDGGSRQVWSWEMRFRFEPETQRMRLIGTEHRMRDRLSSREELTSKNFLTGFIERKGSSYTKDDGKKSPDSRKRTTLEPTVKYLEDAEASDVAK